MNKHFTITLHDENGVRQFNIHQIVKKLIWYIIAFIFFIALIAIGTILYLDRSVDNMYEAKEQLKEAYVELENKNLILEQKMQATKSSLSLKKLELDALSDSLSEIETLVGLKPMKNNLNISQRINSMKISSQHRAVMLELFPNGSPIEYKGITSKFGYRIHPTLHKKEFHRGIDMKAKMNTPVYATADAIVEWAGFHKKSGYGRLVILQHVYGFKTYFGHLKKIVIKSGQFVKKGTLIAYTGNSGMSNGPHLHYEIRFIHRNLNPYYFIKWTQKNYNEIFKKEKKIPWQSLITATAHIKILKPKQIQQSSQQEQK
jgi:murein DD-endopeptidase MepM/ murein hydrolase activator NlpD